MPQCEGELTYMTNGAIPAMSNRSALGHNRAVFGIPGVTELMRRGFLWAAKQYWSAELQFLFAAVTSAVDHALAR